jgi:hypothetical protein
VEGSRRRLDAGGPAERQRELRHRLGDEPVVHPGAALARDLDEPGLAQHPQVVRDGRLRQAERPDEVADADVLGACQPVDDRHAARIGERLETVGQRAGSRPFQRRRSRGATGASHDRQLLH